MSSLQKILHVGIYGLIEQDDKILVILKSRGPYKGLFDLPGGRPTHGEPLLTALGREIEEETGVKVLSYSFLGNFSYLIPYQDEEGNQKELYHIALTYRIDNVDLSCFNASINVEDTKGSVWMSRHQLRKEGKSPLLHDILASALIPN